jgi:hypothetical protein
MSTRGAGRGSGYGRRPALGVIAILVAVCVGGCGSSNFANDPRPSAPIAVTATVTAKKIAVSPNNFGAGVVNFIVANMSASPVHFVISGQKAASSDEIKPGQPGSLEVDLPQGDYRASAGKGASAPPAKFTVGAQRPSSKNRLLLP